MGPMSGRAAGYCAGFGVPGFANPIAGRGGAFGFGRGRGGFGGGGRGWRNMFYATGLPGWMRYANPAAVGAGVMPDSEKEVLQRQAESLQTQLDAITRRLSKFDSGGEAK